MPFAYSVASRAWQLFNKRNRTGTQALGKFLYFSVCSLKSVYLNICFIKRDCDAIHNSNKELQKAVFHLFFLLVFHIPIQNFTTTDACLSTYCWLSLCLPMNSDNIMLQGIIVESRPMIFECFWSNNLSIFIVVSVRDLKLEAKEYLQIICSYPDMVSALLRIELRRLNYRLGYGVLCSSEEQLHKGGRISNCPSSRIGSSAFPIFPPSSTSLLFCRE